MKDGKNIARKYSGVLPQHNLEGEDLVRYYERILGIFVAFIVMVFWNHLFDNFRQLTWAMFGLFVSNYLYYKLLPGAKISRRIYWGGIVMNLLFAAYIVRMAGVDGDLLWPVFLLPIIKSCLVLGGFGVAITVALSVVLDGLAEGVFAGQFAGWFLWAAFWIKTGIVSFSAAVLYHAVRQERGQRRRAQEEAVAHAEYQKLADRLFMVNENAPVGLVLFDVTPDGLNIFYLNKAAAIFACGSENGNRDRFNGASFEEFMRCVADTDEIGELEDIALKGGSKIVNTAGLPKRTILMQFHPIGSCAAGEMPCYLFTAEDVTERQDLQIRMIQSEKLATLGQLSSAIAHELNNPLSVVLGYAQLLRSGVVKMNELDSSIAHIENAALRCRHVVNRFLSFARQQDYDFKELDLNDILQRSAELCRHDGILKGVEIICPNTEKDPPVRMRGSGGHLQQVFVNLVINAIQAMPKGGRVWLRAYEDGLGQACVVVKDEGQGLSAEAQRNLFRPFFTTKPVGLGTGLGLAICKEIIEKHGGQLCGENRRDGAGAQFCVSMPKNVPSDLHAEMALGGGVGGK